MKQLRNTRIEILSLLKKNGQMTAQQIGETLGMTSMGARQHLTAMEGEDLVQSEFVRQKTGRPALYFRITDKADQFFPQRYGSLALAFLQNLEQLEGREKVSQILRLRKQQLLQEYNRHLNTENLRERAQIVARLRDQDGYMAEYRENNGELTIIEYNCPINCVAGQYPELCQQELELFEEALGCPVERQEHIIKGQNACVYKIKGK